MKIRSKSAAVALIGGLAVGAAAWAQTAEPRAADPKTADILRQAKAYQFQVRSGRTDDIPRYVAMLEEATKANPNDAELWNAMGVAYLTKASGVMMSGGGPAEFGPLFQKGPAALQRALAIKPDHAEALATHGGIQATIAVLSRQPELAAKGVSEMNRAVGLAPNSTPVRLQRAFSALNLPDALRNRSTEAQDLDWLIKLAGQSRSGSYVRLLRADLHAEAGERDLAREQYKIISRSNSSAAAAASVRLAALDQGGVPAAEITKLRGNLGNCVMCHGE